MFRAGYPDQTDDQNARANLDFYSNNIAMMPDRLTYEEFMTKNEHDWDELEYNQ
jgi:hypothetical protein